MRAGRLAHDPDDPRRGEGHRREPFVEVACEHAASLVAGDLRNVIGAHGNASVFRGSVCRVDSSSLGVGPALLPGPLLPRGTNGVETFTPVALSTDMLLSSGGPCDYNGVCRRCLDIRLVYWVGGNPFHHH